MTLNCLYFYFIILIYYFLLINQFDCLYMHALIEHCIQQAKISNRLLINMGNSAEGQQSSGKSKLPFFSREQNDYNPLSENQQIGKSLKCSLKVRLVGFVVCCAVGWFVSILGVLALVIKHSTIQFAILYSIGQILNIVGSCFLATPKTQYKKMTDRKRIALTAIYLGAIILTLALGIFLPENLTFLVFISLIGQIIAYFFYTLSYIPYGRKILAKVCKLMMD